jgi:hypothetical protein
MLLHQCAAAAAAEQVALEVGLGAVWEVGVPTAPPDLQEASGVVHTPTPPDQLGGLHPLPRLLLLQSLPLLRLVLGVCSAASVVQAGVLQQLLETRQSPYALVVQEGH